MTSKGLETLELEKSELIEKYITLKSKHQSLFFQYNEIVKENQFLKKENSKLKIEIEEGKSKNLSEKSILKENKVLHAQLNQMKRTSTSMVTPKKTHVKTPSKSTKNFDTSFEVEKLIKHRGRKGNREFLVRWKGFPPEDDTWESEKGLSCPKILKQYLKSKRLA